MWEGGGFNDTNFAELLNETLILHDSCGLNVLPQVFRWFKEGRVDLTEGERGVGKGDRKTLITLVVLIAVHIS